MRVSRLKEFDVIGRLTLLHSFKMGVGNKGAIDRFWYTICECGKTKITRGCALTSKSTQSCGCMRVELMRSIHHLSVIKNTKYSEEIKNSNLFKRWRGIFSRVQVGPQSKNHKIYKGKGITVCNEWNDFYVFKVWAEQSGFDPSLTIDRIDSAKGYSPDNCQWITMSENLDKRNLYKGPRPWLIGNKHGKK